MSIIGTLPNNLTNGTTADATQVMADFNKIVNDVNANAAPLANTALLNAANSFTMVQTGINAAAAANFPTAQQVQNNMAMGSDVGSANAYVINPIVPMSAYANGQLITVYGTQAMNGGAATLSVSGLSANPIVNQNGTSLSSAQIPKGDSFTVVADASNSNFRLQVSGAVTFALSSDIVTGSSGSLVLTPLQTRVALKFSGVFESAQQVITSAGALTIPHGLGRTPVLVQCYLTCISTELNFSVNDVVFIQPNPGYTTTINRGVTVVPDATNLNIRFGSDVNAFALNDKTTGSGATITNNKWAFGIRAWA